MKNTFLVIFIIATTFFISAYASGKVTFTNEVYTLSRIEESLILKVTNNIGDTREFILPRRGNSFTITPDFFGSATSFDVKVNSCPCIYSKPYNKDGKDIKVYIYYSYGEYYCSNESIL